MKHTDEHELDVYFKSPRFTKRLDEIRKKTSDESELKAYAFSVATKLHLKTDHVGVICSYLQSGKYTPAHENHSIEIVDRSKKTRQSKPETNQLEGLGVVIEIGEDTTQKDMHNFIDHNWQEVKEALDNNYDDRIKRFAPTLYIDKYLAIADEVNAIKSGHDKARVALDLATKYDLDTPKIYAIAKQYKSILVE